MSRRRKNALPFDNRGGTIAFARKLVESGNYLTLKPQSKVLFTLLHIHWRNEKPVDYGLREAMEKIPCSRKKAIEAFKELRERGFITCVEESRFSSRTQSKARSWRLEWMPFNSQAPSNKWEKWAREN